MAKLECVLNGSFDEILSALDAAIFQSSMSASFEDGSDITANGCRCAVRVYERYSMAGGNRVSLNLILIEDGERVHLSAITSGGSQAVFFKINTFGEEAFLDCIRQTAERYR